MVNARKKKEKKCPRTKNNLKWNISTADKIKLQKTDTRKIAEFIQKQKEFFRIKKKNGSIFLFNEKKFCEKFLALFSPMNNEMKNRAKTDEKLFPLSMELWIELKKRKKHDLENVLVLEKLFTAPIFVEVNEKKQLEEKVIKIYEFCTAFHMKFFRLAPPKEKWPSSSSCMVSKRKSETGNTFNFSWKFGIHEKEKKKKENGLSLVWISIFVSTRTAFLSLSSPIIACDQ